jgi:hypothetical protein
MMADGKCIEGVGIAANLDGYEAVIFAKDAETVISIGKYLNIAKIDVSGVLPVAIFRREDCR